MSLGDFQVSPAASQVSVGLQEQMQAGPLLCGSCL